MVLLLVMVGVGLAFSSRLAGPVANLLSPFIADPDLRTIVTFAVIFGALLVIAGAASHLLGAITKVLPLLGPFNRLGGIALGVLVGFVILSGALTALQKFPIGGIAETIDESALGTFLVDHFDVVLRGARLVPGDWKFPGAGSK